MATVQMSQTASEIALKPSLLSLSISISLSLCLCFSLETTEEVETQGCWRRRAFHQLYNQRWWKKAVFECIFLSSFCWCIQSVTWSIFILMGFAEFSGCCFFTALFAFVGVLALFSSSFFPYRILWLFMFSVYDCHVLVLFFVFFQRSYMGFSLFCCFPWLALIS